MGGIVADYTVITDGSYLLDVNGNDDRTLSFSLGTRKLKIESGHPILSFMVYHSSHDARLRIDINGRTAFRRDLANSSIERCFQEPAQGMVLHPSGNSIEFSMERGACRVGDMVLWFQRES